ncbi:expressed protein [Arabidopsis lyrata subsp. lyrata]|uniref:Expressed protein n=1 Tax=Arabidopsis lyrata subsp. lyrata TaxID=81972 RepID=D7KLR3_ARALL|nr:expressed protein [Arabidopsis lyrata subsp. lyrata]
MVSMDETNNDLASKRVSFVGLVEFSERPSLGARKRSSLRIASAFANSNNPSISVQNPMMISLWKELNTIKNHAEKSSWSCQ